MQSASRHSWHILIVHYSLPRQSKKTTELFTMEHHRIRVVLGHFCPQEDLNGQEPEELAEAIEMTAARLRDDLSEDQLRELPHDDLELLEALMRLPEFAREELTVPAPEARPFDAADADVPRVSALHRTNLWLAPCLILSIACSDSR